MLNYPKLRNIWRAEKDYILQSHFYVRGYKTHSVQKVIYELEITTKDRESLEKKTQRKKTIVPRVQEPIKNLSIPIITKVLHWYEHIYYFHYNI